MPLYNPLPQLMNRPQGMQGLAMLGGALSNIQRQKQAQAQQQATGQALGSLATYGMEDQEKAQALSQLAEANPQMFMQYQQMQGRGGGQLSAYQQAQVDSKAKAKDLQLKIIDTVEKMRNSEGKEFEDLAYSYNNLVTEHDNLPFISGSDKWKGSPADRFAIDVAKEKRATAEAERKAEKFSVDLEKAKSDVQMASDRHEKEMKLKDAQIQKAYKDNRIYDSNAITKALNDRGLSYPESYDVRLDDSKAFINSGNVFGAVKTLSNIIEPGLSVTEGEVQGYTVGGDSKFDKFIFNTFGASTKDMNEIYSLMVDLIERRKILAQDIIENQGVYKPSKQSTRQESKPQSEKTEVDEFDAWLGRE